MTILRMQVQNGVGKLMMNNKQTNLNIFFSNLQGK